MKNIDVDCESDGPAPGLFSLISLGAVVVGQPNKFFKGLFKPISMHWNPDALAISNITRLEHEAYPAAELTTREFYLWLLSFNDRLTFWSDNVAYDWQWVNYYLHKYIGQNPFGFSGRRIGDLYCGTQKDLRARWKHLRDTKHTHDPVDDARGNAEALQKILSDFR